jgi:GNAT superfamily N-acetyltransferase
MIKLMELSDVARVAEIQVFAWRANDGGIYSDEYLFKDMTVTKRMEYFENMVKNGTDENYVFYDGIIKAFMTLSPCEDGDITNALPISSIYVDPFFQRNGIGSRLVEYYETTAIQRNIKKVSLWVL